MRRRSRPRKRIVAGVVIAVALVALGASLLIPDYGDNRADAGSVPAQAMNRIAQKNDNAAATAAAAMRARSAQAASLADARQDQRDRLNEAQAAH
jgi:hypothetical protein